jgi:hypothetical protein
MAIFVQKAEKARENLSTPCPAGGGGLNFQRHKRKNKKESKLPSFLGKKFTVHKKIRAF